MKTSSSSALLATLALLFPTAIHAESGAAAPIDFRRDVQPILEAKCVSCHREEKDKGSLRMDVAAHFLEGGDSGSPLLPEDPGKSLLLQRIELPEDDDDLMPPKEPFLSAEEKSLLRRWVLEGAPWPTDLVLVDRSGETPAVAAPPSTEKALAALAVYPPAVHLDTKDDRQSLVVTATFEDGTTQEVTSEASLAPAQEGIVEISENRLRGRGDGETTVAVSFRDEKVELPVVVVAASTPRPLSFRNDVMPIFMRAGCNTGECHGSARGQDGFMISLFGYDPKGDHFRLTRETLRPPPQPRPPGRGVPPALPRPPSQVPHTGGKLFEKSTRPTPSTLVDWVAKAVRPLRSSRRHRPSRSA